MRLIVFLLLIGLWVLLTGSLHPFVIMVGVFCSYLGVLALPERYCTPISTADLLKNIVVLPVILLYMLYSAFFASVRMARFILSPSCHFKSTFLDYNYSVRTPVGVFSLAALITLTPGTVSMHLDRKQRLLFVHCLTQLSGEREAATVYFRRMDQLLRRMSL